MNKCIEKLKGQKDSQPDTFKHLIRSKSKFLNAKIFKLYQKQRSLFDQNQSHIKNSTNGIEQIVVDNVEDNRSGSELLDKKYSINDLITLDFRKIEN